jgi:carboxyl-terminal processing protease
MTKYLLVIIAAFIIIDTSSGQEYYGKMPGQKLDWVFYYLEQNYVDTIDNNRLADLAIQRIVKELDPFSSYQTKAEADAQLNKDNGVSAPGTGLLFYMINKTTPVITYVNRDGPAEKAGLKRGYSINSINGEKTEGKNFNQITAMLNDTSFIELPIVYSDHNKQTYTTTIVKEYMPWFSVLSNYMINDVTGYIKLKSFTKNTLEECNNAIDILNSQGMQNLILDLRGNAGGVKEQSIALADEFLAKGKLINSSEGHNAADEEHYSTDKGQFLDGKLICLTDNYTASASEIFLSAIQEWDRGLLLGFPTYGKGLVQQSYKLGDGSTIRLTVGRYYTPTHRNIQKSPDDNWFQELGITIPNGTAMHTLNLADSKFSQTKSQRKIMTGTGGIYPDIYYVHVPENRIALDRYNTGGYIYDFTTHFIHQNRYMLLSKYGNADQFRKDERYMVELGNNFKSYLVQNGFDEANDPDFGVPRNILDLIRSWTASQLWDDNAYYQLTNVTDQTILKALEILDDGTYDRIIRN